MALRPLGPAQGLVPSVEVAPTQVVLAFDDNRHASVLFGQYGQNLALIERRLGDAIGGVDRVSFHTSQMSSFYGTDAVVIPLCKRLCKHGINHSAHRRGASSQH